MKGNGWKRSARVPIPKRVYCPLERQGAEGEGRIMSPSVVTGQVTSTKFLLNLGDNNGLISKTSIC